MSGKIIRAVNDLQPFVILGVMISTSKPLVGLHRSFLTHLPNARTYQNRKIFQSSHVKTVTCKKSGELSSEIAVPETPKGVRSVETVRVSIALFAFIFAGVVNRVSYKIALVPLKDYVFFVAQLQTLVYMAVYLPILYLRYKSGIVTDQMLSISKTPFIFIGFCESVASLLLLVSAARLPGVLLPVLQQMFTLWLMIVSTILLKSKYSTLQILGAGLVVVGSSLAVVATTTKTSVGEVNVFFIMLLNVALVLYALATATKERLFIETKELLNGQNLDIFVVNSFGSLAQSFGVLMFFPLTLRIRELSIRDIPRYLSETAMCFCGLDPTPTSNCAGASVAVLAYFTFNIGFNILALYLVRKVGAVVTSLTGSIIVLATITVFSFPLPILGPGTQLSAVFIIGAAILVSGMLTYSSREIIALRQNTKKTDKMKDSDVPS